MKILLLCAFFAVEICQCLNVGLDLRKMEDCTRRRFTTLAVAKGVVLQRSPSFHFSKDSQQFNLGKPLDSLPSETQLMTALDSFYQLQIESELSEFKTTQKMKWLKYLPTVGVTYTLEGKPRPAVSWSSNLLYSSQKDKALIFAKKQSIYKKNQLALEKEKLKLKNLLRQHHFLKQDVFFLQKLFEYDQQLFEIKKDQADKIQIPPSELLKAKQALRKKEYNIFLKQRELLELETQILFVAKYFL